jgi:hypothetical protein
VTQSSTLNFAGGQISSSSLHALPIRFQKLRTAPAITLRYDHLCCLGCPRLKRTIAQTSLLRALAPTTPTYVFPAMNTLMYNHPLTSEHLRVVKDVIGYHVVGPIGKALACGDVGKTRPLVHQSTAKLAPRSWCDDGVERYRADHRRPVRPTRARGGSWRFINSRPCWPPVPPYPRRADCIVFVASSSPSCYCNSTTRAFVRSASDSIVFVSHGLLSSTHPIPGRSFRRLEIPSK